jgi:hypothetical protein
VSVEAQNVTASRARAQPSALAYVTGVLSLLREHLRPDPLLFVTMPQGGLSDAQQIASAAIGA